jgi:hypothetical protein
MDSGYGYKLARHESFKDRLMENEVMFSLFLSIVPLYCVLGVWKLAGRGVVCSWTVLGRFTSQELMWAPYSCI